jgi:2-polyprenyl-6-methoxyphenol hydroxylase-like FAD-dependent oxidoreductase
MSTDSTTVVLIIGGGLGGLALAQLLLQGSSSIKVLVFERDKNDNSREQGYCIGINQTGLEVLNKIQVLHDLLSAESDGFHPLSYFRMINRHFRELLVFPVPEGGSKLVYRDGLRRALLTNIDVQWDKRFISYKIVDDGIVANFEDGTSVHGTILIGCDGAKSLVRAQLIPEYQRNDLHILNTGGTTEQNNDLKKIQKVAKDSLVRMFGEEGHSLLVIPFRQFWMWSLSWPEKENHEKKNVTLNELVDKARRYFKDDEIVRLIEGSSSLPLYGPIRMHSAPCFKQNPFPNNPRVTLLGDAAHSMTTQAGLGANTAFADAYDLANVLLNPSSSSLAEYEQKMFKRGFTAVKMSLTSTTMIHLTGWRALLRDCILPIIYYTITLISVISTPFRWFKKKRD